MKLLALATLPTLALSHPFLPTRAIIKVGPNNDPTDRSGCHGLITMLTYPSGKNIIKWNLKNCGREGYHGFHIHSVADFSDGCQSTGGHYNPTGEEHGATKDEIRHVGDMPQIYVNKWGNSRGVSMDSKAILTGEFSVVGKPLVIHEGQDDEGEGGEACSKANGCAGARIACGTVELVWPWQ